MGDPHPDGDATMKTRSASVRVTRLVLGLALSVAGARAAEPHAGQLSLALQEHLGHQWQDELLHYRVEFPKRSCRLETLRVMEGGSAMPVRCQVSATEYWPGDRQFVKSCTVSIRTGLAPLEKKEFLVQYGSEPRDGGRSRDRTATAIAEEEDGDTVTASNSVFSVRLFHGERKFGAGKRPTEAPPPILSVKRGDGPWLARGALRTNTRVIRAKGERTESGPLFNDYRFQYALADAGSYVMKLRFLVGQDYLLVEERAPDRKEGAFVCSFAEQRGLPPPDRLWIHRKGGRGTSRTLTYEKEIRHARLTCFSQYRQLFDMVDWLGLYWSKEAHAKTGALVGVVSIGAGDWTRCSPNIISAHETPDGRFEVRFPLVGRRQWALVVTDKAKATAVRRKGERTTYLNDLHTKLSFCPLDEIKDMVLDWKPVAAPKRPLMSPPSIYQNEKPRPAPKSALLLPGGWSPLGTKNLTLDLGLMGSYIWPSICVRHIQGWCEAYDELAAKDALTEPEDKLVRASLAFLAYKLHDRDYYPWNKACLPDEDPESIYDSLYLGMLNVNFNTDRYSALASVALCFPNHPMSETWLRHYQSQVDCQYRKFVHDCGAWAESPGYEDHVKKTFFRTWRVLKWRGIRDYFSEPRWWRFWEFPIHTFTPYHPKTRARTSPTMGDHSGRRSRYLFYGLARELAEENPALSRRLAWAWQEYGGKPDKRHAALTSEKQALTSRALPGIGCTMRANFGTEDETMVMFRVGRAWEHRHHEQGSFHLYAHGSPLAVDAGDGNGPLKFGHRGHNVIQFDGKDAFQIFNLPGAQGRMTRFRSTPVADLAIAETPITYFARNSPTMGELDFGRYPAPSLHTRHVLFLKPDCVVLHDAVRSPYASEWLMHVICNKADVTGNRVHFDGAYQHDLDAIFLEPPNPEVKIIESKGYAHTRGVAVPNAPGRGYLCVLQIRRKGAALVAVRYLVKGKVVEISREGEKAIAFVSPDEFSYSDGPLRFEGKFGLARIDGERISLCLLAGKELSHSGRKAASEGAVETFEIR